MCFSGIRRLNVILGMPFFFAYNSYCYHQSYIHFDSSLSTIYARSKYRFRFAGAVGPLSSGSDSPNLPTDQAGKMCSL